MARFTSWVILAISLVASTTAFPAHRSLAGLSREDLEEALSSLDPAVPKDPPPPLAFNGTKLVNDAAHPWMPLEDGDERGPCPGLNVLASHGWLPRNGIATPFEIASVSQEGFNFESTITRRFVYSSHLIDGNLVTDLLSIGGKSNLTGSAGGLNLHGPVEGDAGMTRADAFFGNGWQFNETLFDELVEYMNKFGEGKFNYTVAGEFRWQRIQESIATNPEFSFTNNRFESAYTEVVVANNLFADGRRDDHSFDVEAARSFFKESRMPDDFHRANKPYGTEGIDIIFNLHPFKPGTNVNGINTYTVDPNSATFENDPSGCRSYEWFVNNAVVPLYPNPSGVLLRNLKINLQFYYDTFPTVCEQLFPYGK